MYEILGNHATLTCDSSLTKLNCTSKYYLNQAMEQDLKWHCWELYLSIRELLQKAKRNCRCWKFQIQTQILERLSSSGQAMSVERKKRELVSSWWPLIGSDSDKRSLIWNVNSVSASADGALPVEYFQHCLFYYQTG